MGYYWFNRQEILRKAKDTLKKKFVPVDNFNANNKNDSSNKLIIVKKSRQTDQNDNSCKKKQLFLYFALYQKHCQRIIKFLQ